MDTKPITLIELVNPSNRNPKTLINSPTSHTFLHQFSSLTSTPFLLFASQNFKDLFLKFIFLLCVLFAGNIISQSGKNMNFFF